MTDSVPTTTATTTTNWQSLAEQCPRHAEAAAQDLRTCLAMKVMPEQQQQQEGLHVLDVQEERRRVEWCLTKMATECPDIRSIPGTPNGMMLARFLVWAIRLESVLALRLAAQYLEAAGGPPLAETWMPVLRAQFGRVSCPDCIIIPASSPKK